jgi:hypothetical protein
MANKCLLFPSPTDPCILYWEREREREDGEITRTLVLLMAVHGCPQFVKNNNNNNHKSCFG